MASLIVCCSMMEVMAAHLHVLGPILLLGLLDNYMSEFRNPYQQRLDDFVNEATIQIIVAGTRLSMWYPVEGRLVAFIGVLVRERFECFPG
jgi:hypothetical protein